MPPANQSRGFVLPSNRPGSETRSAMEQDKGISEQQAWITPCYNDGGERNYHSARPTTYDAA